MEDFFGLSMTAIATGCVVATAIVFGIVAFIAIRNPVMFKMGLRNIPRRPAQTSLIVIGLMLATLIITAALGTGDTLTRSITAVAYEQLADADEIVLWDAERHPAPQEDRVIPLAFVEELRGKLENDGDVDAVVPVNFEPMPIFNERTKLNEALAQVTAFRKEDVAALGGLRDTKGRVVELSGNDVAVNDDLADEIDARVGDTLLGFYAGKPVEMKVKAIVPTNVLAGVTPLRTRGAAVDRDFLAGLTGKNDVADAIFISNRGGVRDGIKLTDGVQARLEPLLAGTNYRSESFKQDVVDDAKLVGNIFTSFFLILGLFSIAAGILLIFLIFVMLAAERKPEMGMARAVGAKRMQLVQSFLAEGLGYDFGSAIVGLLAGILVTFVMIGILEASSGELLNVNLEVTFTLRGLLVAFCLGIIVTFLVIFLAALRASRLNIVAAIRDLPESHKIDAEAATGAGLRRAILNGVAAMGLPAGLMVFFLGSAAVLWAVLAMVVGWIAPWVYVLRTSNFGQPKDVRTDEGLPRWPWITGAVIPVLGWVGVLVPYFIAAGLVAVTRDRRPGRLPTWLVIAGIVIPPLGLALVLLQQPRVSIAWSVGIFSALAIGAAALFFYGLDHDNQFTWGLGISILFLWVAILLRYFRLPERPIFSVTAVILLATWFLTPAGMLEWLFGELNGDFEMFFLSGLVMVSSGVFLVVYNADILLGVVGAFGEHFGRILPAVRTGVAYPLRSKFRTGMTMAMIGLIMFALVAFSAINSNFAAVFLGDAARGGWDVQVLTAQNNRIDDFGAALQRAGIPRAEVTAVGENLIATFEEAEVENRDRKKDEDGLVPPYLRYTVIGADDTFLAQARVDMRLRAKGYDSDAAILEAVRSKRGFAVIPSRLTASEEDFGPQFENLLHLDQLRDGFEPFTLKLRDSASGGVRQITVIGQAKDSAALFWDGIIISQDDLRAAYPKAETQIFYLQLAQGVKSRDFAKRLESGLLTVSVESVDKLLDEQQALQSGFLLVFQGFMGLGLIVGIAALGVVASRAVVERRQQIGMLRAIGYQRGMVSLSFLFESGFIAISGIAIGMTLGLSLAWVLFTNEAIGEESADIAFRVPWGEIGFIVGLSFVASMVMTLLPARAASRVPIAEALRYE